MIADPRGPGLVAELEPAINPVLAALLYVTFLQVPAAELVRSLRAGRFLAAALAVNFAVVPLVVAAMFAFLPADQAVRLGVLLVLLTPLALALPDRLAVASVVVVAQTLVEVVGMVGYVRLVPRLLRSGPSRQ
ncbi:hypothetical protein GCM10009850_099640 [Nonomuraea monospora]|uniref:Arsenic resistance protein n=1 Tax=Nonomuraea monospora TaxID=568818 RepID=A0ABN3CYA4_9ACTN